MSITKAFKIVKRYSSCIDELIDLAETIHTSVKDGKVPREERSLCMKKFWALVKAVEDSTNS